MIYGIFVIGLSLVDAGDVTAMHRAHRDKLAKVGGNGSSSSCRIIPSDRARAESFRRSLASVRRRLPGQGDVTWCFSALNREMKMLKDEIDTLRKCGINNTPKNISDKMIDYHDKLYELMAFQFYLDFKSYQKQLGKDFQKQLGKDFQRQICKDIGDAVAIDIHDWEGSQVDEINVIYKKRDEKLAEFQNCRKLLQEYNCFNTSKSDTATLASTAAQQVEQAFENFPVIWGIAKGLITSADREIQNFEEELDNIKNDKKLMENWKNKGLFRGFLDEPYYKVTGTEILRLYEKLLIEYENQITYVNTKFQAGARYDQLTELKSKEAAVNVAIQQLRDTLNRCKKEIRIQILELMEQECKSKIV